MALAQTVSARIHHYSLPLSDSPAAADAGPRREGALLELTGDDGAVGLGEAAPLPGFSRESVQEAVRRLAAAYTAPEPGAESAGELPPSARYASELAELNLRARASGEPLPRLLSPAPRDTVRLGALLSGPPESMPGEARRLREAGYRAVKLKVGRRPVEEEAALVVRLADALDGVSLRLDANRAWSPAEALAFARGVSGVEIEYVEEPLCEPALLPRFAEESGLPVALDESLVGMPAAGLAEHGYAAAVVLKPTLLGGVSRALALAARADDLGMKPVVSSAFESGVGTLGLVALAAALPGDGAPAGLDPYRSLGADVLRPPLAIGPTLNVEEVFGTEHALERCYLGETILAGTKS